MGELVITAVGTDRSGIVGEFSGHVVAANLGSTSTDRHLGLTGAKLATQGV